MAMFKKYMQAIYTAPVTLLSSNNNHRNQYNWTDLVDIKKKKCCVQHVSTTSAGGFFRLYL